MNLISKVTLSTALILQLSACVPAIIGGAAVGGAMAADRRTSGIYVEDENIELKAGNKLKTNLGEYAHVNVTSFNRNVLLTGQVPDAAKRALAETLLKEVENVRNINNEITVGASADISTRTNDTYLTSKIKTRFLADGRFNANNVKVVTEDSVAYLMGLVTKAEGDAAVEVTRNTYGVTKVVKLFEYIN
jgi:osmotically-inducible protein OsmY